MTPSFNRCKNGNKKKTYTQTVKRFRKKAGVSGTRFSINRFIPVIALLIMAALTVAYQKADRFAWDVVETDVVAATLPETAASYITFPANDFSNGKARFFTYKTAEEVTVKYFIVKSADGTIRAAFDACNVCWREKKGYKQDGDFMVCTNCGKKFRTDRINEVTGGCNPAGLSRTIKDGKVVISLQALNEGTRFFK
jgi:uncharacterized membrane protein